MLCFSVSYELSLEQQHDITVNGYNLGRDWLVGNATNSNFANPNPLSTQGSATSSGPSIIPSASYTGSTSANGWTYQTTATYVTGLLQATSVGINHNTTVEEDGRPAVDGLVALLTVSITARNECVCFQYYEFTLTFLALEQHRRLDPIVLAKPSGDATYNLSRSLPRSLFYSPSNAFRECESLYKRLESPTFPALSDSPLTYPHCYIMHLMPSRRAEPVSETKVLVSPTIMVADKIVMCLRERLANPTILAVWPDR